jgi:hypothetical protein
MSLILSGTDGLSDVDGTAATPAIRGTDANTGIFFPSADTIAFAEGGAEVARFDSSGNLGLGVTPSSWGAGTSVIDLATSGNAGAVSASGTLSIANNGFFNGTNWIYKNTNSALLYQLISNQHRWSIAPSGTAGNAITFTQAMTLDASGNLGVGTTSPSGRLHVNSTGAAIAYIQSTLAAGNTNVETRYISTNRSWGVGQNIIQTSSIFEIADITAGATRLAIDSSGAMMVGSTSWLGGSSYQSGGLQLGGSTYAMLTIQTGGTIRGQFLYDNANTYLLAANTGNFYVYNSSGGVYLSSGATSWTASSDERLKNIIEPITDAANKVNQLRAVIGKFKTDAEGTRRSFLIAQDVQAVLPEAVTESKSKDQDQAYLGVSYTDVIPLLVAAIKEQQALITQLTARITALESA